MDKRVFLIIEICVEYELQALLEHSRRFTASDGPKVYRSCHAEERPLRFPGPLTGGKRGRRVTPSLMSDVDRVWLSRHHPSVNGELLHKAAQLAPDEAADLLLHYLPGKDDSSNLAERLDCLGIAVGSLTPSFASRGHARSFWRSTLPVLLVTDPTPENGPSPHEVAEQVGYLVYGSALGRRSHQQVRDFATRFESGLLNA